MWDYRWRRLSKREWHPSECRWQRKCSPTVRPRSHAEPIIVYSLICIDHNVIALADSKRKLSSNERLDRNEVRGHDREGMSIERNTESAVHGGVDNSYAVFLSLGDGHLCIFATACTDMSAVDENIVGAGRASLGVLCYLVESKSLGVVVVCERQDTQILVVIDCGRAINDHGANHTIAILSRPMRVVPGRAELGRSESVLASLSGGDWAFCNSRDTVLLT